MVTGDDPTDGVNLAEDEVGTGIVGFLGGVFHVSVMMLMSQDEVWFFRVTNPFPIGVEVSPLMMDESASPERFCVDLTPCQVWSM